MVMKQTQTKLFDFADVGLDFCPGSKNLFPDRFKKMLSQGYNEQTVASVSVTGNQVTLNYGVAHGYAVDRVLKISSGPLAAINGGEFWIDAVTTTSLTMTIDAAPVSMAGGFVTKIASLGWELVYELANIHIYKMKHIDDTNRYVRMCFQNNATHRNAIAVCIGKTFDAATGFINDPLALQSTATVTSPSAGGLPRWDGYLTGAAHNDWTYTQGYSTYGKAIVIGSLYHLLLPLCWGTTYPIEFYGILPTALHAYDVLDYPVLIAKALSSATSSGGEFTYGNFYLSSGSGRAYVGNVAVVFQAAHGDTSNNTMSYSPAARSSALSNNIDLFNTTTAEAISIYEESSWQHLGYCYGAYRCQYAGNSTAPTISRTNLPLFTTDVDFENTVLIAHSGSSNDRSRAYFFAIPIEEIKID